SLGALRSAIAGIGAESGEGNQAARLKFFCGRLHKQADLPVAGVIAEGDGRAIVGSEAAGGGEDEKFLAADLGGIPPHAGVLGEAEEIAAGPVEEHLLGEGKRAGGAGGASV